MLKRRTALELDTTSSFAVALLSALSPWISGWLRVFSSILSKLRVLGNVYADERWYTISALPK